jgi:hypothetical protein
MGVGKLRRQQAVANNAAPANLASQVAPRLEALGRTLGRIIRAT